MQMFAYWCLARRCAWYTGADTAALLREAAAAAIWRILQDNVHLRSLYAISFPLKHFSNFMLSTCSNLKMSHVFDVAFLLRHNKIGKKRQIRFCHAWLTETYLDICPKGHDIDAAAAQRPRISRSDFETAMKKVDHSSRALFQNNATVPVESTCIAFVHFERIMLTSRPNLIQRPTQPHYCSWFI